MNEVLKVSRSAQLAPFADGAAELAAQMVRINAILRAAVARFRHSHALEERNGVAALAVFDEEVDRFLSALPNVANGHADTTNDDRLCCESRTRDSAAQGIHLPIDIIRRRFGLGPIELDALLLCIAAELHPGYGRVFAYLNNDLARQRPSVALMVEILSATWAKRLEVRAVLGQRAPLFRLGLLGTLRPASDHMIDDLMVEPAILDFVLRDQLRSPSMESNQEPTFDELLISSDERAKVEGTIRYLQRGPATLEPVVMVISGAPRTGRRSTAQVICRALGYRLCSTDKETPATTAELALWLRDTSVAGNVPGIYVPRASAEEAPNLSVFVNAICGARCGLAFLFVEVDEPPRLAAPERVHVLKIHLEPPRADLRTAAWKRALHMIGMDCTDDVLSTVAAIYPFNVGRIHATAKEAGLRWQVADSRARPVTAAMLSQACREQTCHRLERLAQPLPIRQGWDDIVLPPDELRRLKEIAGAVRSRDRVMEGWGFKQKMSAGPGINAIFFGPSGTGKTMAASILAGDLGMAIYRVDLSRVVSKYIGETERNLDALFEEARRSFAILFFDEAEALYGKRSEVKDAHDRYANIEVAYLLQRMEAFEGVAILATNLRMHMDSAFLRRLQFAVEFPLPTAAQRLRIWRQVWPKAAQLDDDIDLDFMAHALEFSGGHIRNIALMAAYLAAEERAPISMAHLIAATRREFQKLGRHCGVDQFGPYASLLAGEPPC